MFKLATPWRDGTADIVMSQLNSLQRMAALRLRLWSNSVGRPLQGAESRRSGTRFGSAALTGASRQQSLAHPPPPNLSGSWPAGAPIGDLGQVRTFKIREIRVAGDRSQSPADVDRSPPAATKTPKLSFDDTHHLAASKLGQVAGPQSPELAVQTLSCAQVD